MIFDVIVCVLVGNVPTTYGAFYELVRSCFFLMSAVIVV